MCDELLGNVEVTQMAAEPEPDQVAAPVDKAEEPLHNKKLQKLQKQYERRGIVYVSRIPPHMVRTSLESCSCVVALCESWADTQF